MPSRPPRFLPPQRNPRLLIALLLPLVATLALPPPPARAAVPILRAYQDDLDGDGLPDRLTFDCAFTTPHDRVQVYDRAGDMPRGDDPLALADFDDDVWLFDARADGAAELIIFFDRYDGVVSAAVFDDLDGDGAVSYQFTPAGIQVTESAHPHLHLTASPTWTLPDGSLNPDLRISVDGLLPRYLAWGEALPGRDWALENIRTDGVVDWTLQILDQDHDGSPDLQLQRLLAPFPDHIPVFRTTLYLDRANRKALPYPDAVFWPLLVGKHDYETYNYFAHTPAIAVDWLSARIDRAGILGYPAEQGYHFNSWLGPWEDGRLNPVDFESPMAYYDLAADRDGDAELFIRLEHFPPDDRFFLAGRFPEPMTEIEYAWDADDDRRWDFQLNLAGRLPLDSRLDFPGFSIAALPYDDLPFWVSDKVWDAALFVAAEGAGYGGGEGMSVWTVNRGFRDGQLVEPSGLRNRYITGLTAQPPLNDYSQLPPGFRGERAFEFFQQPRLYLSAIDRRLHLASAEGGLWVLDDHTEIRYDDLDSDAFVDHWEVWQASDLQARLAYLASWLVFAGDGRVHLKPLDLPPSLFETSPPRTHAEWLALNEKLLDMQLDLDPAEFDSWPSRFPEPDTLIYSAGLSGLRAAPSGFRFVLALEPDFYLDGDDHLGLSGLPPGDYLVEYDGVFNVRPLTPAHIEIDLFPDTANPETLTSGRQSGLAIDLSNTGLADADVRLVLNLTSLAGALSVSLPSPEPLHLLAGESTRLQIPWRPSAAGSWEISVHALWTTPAGDPASSASPPALVIVLPSPQPAPLETLTAFGQVHPATLALSLLAALLACTLTARLLLPSRSPRGER